MREHQRRTDPEVFDILFEYLEHLGIPTKPGDPDEWGPLWDGEALDLGLMGRQAADIAHEIAHWVLEEDRRDEENYGWVFDYQYPIEIKRSDHQAEVNACALGITMLNLAGSEYTQDIWSDYSFFDYRDDPRQPMGLVLRIGREAIEARQLVADEVDSFRQWLAAQGYR